MEGYVGPTFFDLTAADKLKIMSLAGIIIAIVFFIIKGIIKTIRKDDDFIPKKPTEKKVKKIVKKVVKRVAKKKVKKDTK